MLFWRILSIAFLIIGFYLLIQSIITANIILFYWALACYAIASIIWLTIQKLYVEPFTPKTKSSKNSQNDWLDWLDLVNVVDILLSLPKYIFYFLIKVFHHLD